MLSFISDQCDMKEDERFRATYEFFALVRSLHSIMSAIGEALALPMTRIGFQTNETLVTLQARTSKSGGN